MASEKIIAAASDPIFYTRVAFIALKSAQNVASEPIDTVNHENRVNYAARVMTGKDKAILLALHVVASNPTIAGKLDAGQDVPDGDIEFALGSIWDARSNAFAAPVLPPILGDQ